MITLRSLPLLTVLLLPLCADAQQPPPAPRSAPTQNEDKGKQDKKPPQVRYNVMQVCTPPQADSKLLQASLEKIPERASLTPDFEITRGRTSLADAAPARYVRLRREMKGEPAFGIVQYSISTDAETVTETLVFKPREPKDLLLISLEANASASAGPASNMLAMNTPPVRIKLERLNAASVGLSRCEEADQAAYEPIFRQASGIMAAYRKLLGLRNAFRSDVAWLNQTPQSQQKTPPQSKTNPKTATPEKKPKTAK